MAITAPADEGYWTPPTGFLAGVLIAALAVSGAAYLVVAALPNIGIYGPHHAFPALRDPGTLVMTLSRSTCFWDCPAYRVAVHGDGQVVYDGGRCAALVGEHRYRIAPAEARALFVQFRALDFFSLRDSYVTEVADAQTRTLSIAFDGHVKTVIELGGAYAGLPAGVMALQRAIDRATGAREKAYGNGIRYCP